MIGFGGEIYSIRVIAEKTGRTEESIKRRLKRGGIDYAVSDAKTYQQYERSHHENIHKRTDLGDTGCWTEIRGNRTETPDGVRS